MLRKLNLLVIGCGLVFGAQQGIAGEQYAQSTSQHHAAADKSANKHLAKTTPRKLTPSKLSTTQIIEKNARARGGLQAWRAVKSMQMTGVMDAGYIKPKPQLDPASTQLNRSLSRMGRIQAAMERAKQEQNPGKLVQVPFTMDLQRPRKQRLEVKYADATAVQVYDGKQGWKLRPYMKHDTVEAYSPQELKLAQLQTELDGPLLDYKAKGYKVNVEGMEQVNGKNAYRLKVAMPGDHVRHVWIDARTFLDVQIDETRKLGGKPRAVITALNDYKEVNGLKIPFEMVTHVEGASHTPPSKISVEKVTLNPRLGADVFAKP
ncbi:MAG: outer membrane lipoprotein-sorting protein [Gammaproteobacteria bacterium]|nr:outer membrane lipoprotein-sorting protein [Gammaproteobacteria bacterium]